VLLLCKIDSFEQSNKVLQRRGPQVKQELTDESEVELDISEDDAEEIFDRIEVELWPSEN